MARMRSEDHGWDADDALFRPRPPILSHRRPRPTRRGAWLTATVLALGVATLTGGTLSLHTGTGPDQAHNPPAPLTRYPPTAQVSAPDAGSGPASPATSSQPSSRRPAPGPTTDPDAATPRPAAPPTRPADPPTTNQLTPAGPTPAPTTAGPPSPALVAPADGLTVLLTNQASGQYAGVAQAATWDGARITQSTSTGAGQQWRLVTAAGGCYHLVNAHSGMALDDPDGSTDDGTQMQQWTAATGNVNQTWCFQSVGAGRYSIRNAASGCLLDLRDGRSGDGVPIQQWGADPAAPNANQTWQLVRVG